MSPRMEDPDLLTRPQGALTFPVAGSSFPSRKGNLPKSKGGGSKPGKIDSEVSGIYRQIWSHFAVVFRGR